MKSKKITPIKKETVYLFDLNERILIGNNITAEKTYEGIIIAESIQKKFLLTAVEVKKFGIETNKTTNGISWNLEGKNHRLKISFSDAEIAVIKQAYKNLNEKKQFSIALRENYEKIVLGK